MSDKELLALIRDDRSNRYGFSLLVQKYHKQVYWHIRHMVLDHEDANDLVQEVFIKVWKGLNNFREDSSLYTWIYRIATNECMSFLKKQQLRYLIPFTGKIKELAETVSDDPYFTGDDVQMKLQKAIIQLPPKQRLVFNMKYYEDMTYETMSEILKTSVGALKASYHIAVRKIEGSIVRD